MDLLHHALWPGGKFLGVEWSVWKVVGWVGNVVFTSRFFVQWYATEKRKQVVMPVIFWWLSLAGSFSQRTGAAAVPGLRRRLARHGPLLQPMRREPVPTGRNIRPGAVK